MVREMKDSEIEWIGKMPKNWNLNRIQSCLLEINDKNLPIKTTQILSLVKDKGVMFYENKGNVGNKAKENVAEYKLAYPNTLIVNSMNVLIGSVGISNYFGCVSPVYYIFRETDKADLRFINYIFNTREFQTELKKYANGILEIRLRVSADDIFKRKIPLPTTCEQKKIANYLDKKCAEIDSLSSDIQLQISILENYKKSVITEAVTKGLNPDVEMKDSEIKWASIVPLHWHYSKIKYEIMPIQRFIHSDDLVLTCFRDGVVTLRQNRREDGFTISFTEKGYQGVEVGDLVIHGMDAFAGAIGCSDSRGKITPVVHVCKTTGNNRFFMYILRSMAINDVFTNYAEGIRVRSSDFRNFNKLGKFPIAVPPIKEQNEIVFYLDKMCEGIEAVVVQKKEQLEVIDDYKKSLIYEYVTGKKEVIIND